MASECLVKKLSSLQLFVYCRAVHVFQSWLWNLWLNSKLPWNSAHSEEVQCVYEWVSVPYSQTRAVEWAQQVFTLPLLSSAAGCWGGAVSVGVGVSSTAATCGGSANSGWGAGSGSADSTTGTVEKSQNNTGSAAGDVVLWGLLRPQANIANRNNVWKVFIMSSYNKSVYSTGWLL